MMELRYLSMKGFVLGLLLLAVVDLPWLCTGEGKEGDEELLIGWKGETYEMKKKSIDPEDSRVPWVETISWIPRAFVYHNFLTIAECEHITTLGQAKVSRSLVIDAKTGETKLDDIRTSYGASFGMGEDPVIAGIEQRVSEWTHLPPGYQEPMQVLRYMDGQKYDAHWDWFDNQKQLNTPVETGNRVATVVLYLSDVEEGGETSLPLAEPLDVERQTSGNLSACAARGSRLAVKPRKGDALLFWDLDVEGRVGDRKTLHASCPTLKGTKWTATKWIHNRPFIETYNPLFRAGQCKDVKSDCRKRAAQGECDSNPEHMLGRGGWCRKTCQDCQDCPKGDLICARRNLRSLRSSLVKRDVGGRF